MQALTENEVLAELGIDRDEFYAAHKSEHERALAIEGHRQKLVAEHHEAALHKEKRGSDQPAGDMWTPTQGSSKGPGERQDATPADDTNPLGRS